MLTRPDKPTEVRCCSNCNHKMNCTWHKNHRLIAKGSWKYTCGKCRYKQAKNRYSKNFIPTTLPELRYCKNCSKPMIARWTPMSTLPSGGTWMYKCQSCSNRWCRYGITLDICEQILINQNGKCAICNTILNNKFVIDHCHTTGVVRGLLCNDCNLGLGKFNDDIARLSKAVEYLSKLTVWNIPA